MKCLGAHKYGAKPQRVGGRYFASNLEAERAAELALLERAGVIRDLTYQPTVLLADAVRYKPDYRYVESATGRVIHEDAKGFEGERWRVICQLWRRHGPTTLRITKRSGHKIIVAREILPGRAA